MRLVMKEYTGLCYYIVKQKLADFSAEEIEGRMCQRRISGALSSIYSH